MSGRIVRLLPRHALLTLAALAALHGLLLVAQARLTARTIAGLDASWLPALLIVTALRALVSWTTEATARRGAATVKERLRGRLLAAAERQDSSGQFATLLVTGLDTLDASLSDYVPQLAFAVLVPPLVIGQLAFADPMSALIVAATLPLVPVFGVLIGLRTRDATRSRWAHLQRLGGHFRDVLAGLPTLRAFDRTAHQAGVIRELAHGHRRATMRALRNAFLSGLVLESLCAVSVALIAVPVGVRLLDGRLDLRTGLLVLILAPEAYGPLRALGARFHAGAEGMAVAERIQAVLAEPSRPAAGGEIPAAGGEIRFEEVTVRFPGREQPALDRLSFTVRSGERLAVVGPSGAGKSTILHLLLGFLVPDSGRILIDGRDLRELDVEAWRQTIAWLPQHPHLFAGTVRDNIRLGLPDAAHHDVVDAARAAGAHGFVEDLPDGYDTPIGEVGTGLSAGQRQRVALARAYLRDAPVVLFDEPTARLDLASEQAVVSAAGELLAGRTAILVAHRPALLARADRVLRLTDGRGHLAGPVAVVDGSAA